MRLISAFLLSVILHLGLLSFFYGLVGGRSVSDPRPLGPGMQAAVSVRLGGALGRVPVEISKRELPQPDFKKTKSVSTESTVEGDAIVSAASLFDAQSFYVPLVHYFGPDELTQRPVVSSDFSLDVDEVTTNPGSGAMVLTLFVNNSGEVDRVEFESGEIDAGIRDVLLRRFSEATFTPGQRDGVQVHSRIKIEVVVAPTLSR